MRVLPRNVTSTLLWSVCNYLRVGGLVQPLNHRSAASGDLRDLIYTINKLPETYSRKITVLLNDKDPTVTARNLLILLILGKLGETDPAIGAELALHLWYSAFVPAIHPFMTMMLLLPMFGDMAKPTFTVQLRQNSTLTGCFKENQICAGILGHLGSKYDFEQAQQEYQRVL